MFNHLKKNYFVWVYDACAVALSWAVVQIFYSLLVNTSIEWLSWVTFKCFIILIFIQLVVNIFCGLYRGVWRFASIPDLMRIIKASIIGSGLSFIAVSILHLNTSPSILYLLYVMVLFLMFSAPRFLYRWLKDRGRLSLNARRVLVIGAGEAADLFLRGFMRDRDAYNMVGLVDDSAHMQRRDLLGCRILGITDHIPFLIKKYKIDLLVLAIPSASIRDKQRIIGICEPTGVEFRTLPGIDEVTAGKVSINALKSVSIEDLLGREPVNLDRSQLSDAINNKTIIVSGGGGSIGSELCRQIVSFGPECLIVIDNSEYNLYEIEKELEQSFTSQNIIYLLESVCDQSAMSYIMDHYKPDIVFHAAAYKHVPILQHQVRVAVTNNILGTKVIAEAAIKARVPRFVLVSTDKAVNPTNIMGMTKRASEVLCQLLGRHAATTIVTTRFGNVMGSRGSVIPLFKSQLEAGGPLTVTHPDITRYFMTIPEAAQLILQTMVISDAEGGVFALDMGEPVKITYLAEQLIRLSGKEPYVDINIQFTGLRPGEKLYEELFYENERLIGTVHKKIFKADHKPMSCPIELFDYLLEAAANQDEKQLLHWLNKIVPEYRI